MEMTGSEANGLIKRAVSYIRRNNPSEAFYIFNGVIKSNKSYIAKSLLMDFILSEIGIANIPLLKYLLPLNMSKLKNIIMLASQSYKSPIVKYMDVYFRKWYIEPMPNVISFLNDMSGEFDINYLRIGSSMYWANLDVQFWKIISMGLSEDDQNFINVLDKIAQYSKACSAHAFILGILFKYYNDNNVEFPSRSEPSKFIELKKLRLLGYISNNYSQLEDTLFDHEKWKKAYIPHAKYYPTRGKLNTSSSDYFHINSAKIIYDVKNPKCHPEKAKSLEDLGTIRIAAVYMHKPLIILCWWKSKCYQLYELKKMSYEESEHYNTIIRKYVGKESAPKSKHIKLRGKFKAFNTGSLDFRYEDDMTNYAISERPVLYGTLNTAFYKHQKTHLDFEICLMRHVKSIFGIKYDNSHIMVMLRSTNIFGIYAYPSVPYTKADTLIRNTADIKKYGKFLGIMADKIIKDLDSEDIKNKRIIRRAKVIKYRTMRYGNYKSK